MNPALPPELQTSPHLLMEESFRWYGPNDQVTLPYIRQTGATAVFNSLHEIPYGDQWPREAIRARREIIERGGLRWTAVESVPVHESIRTGEGDLDTLFRNYAETLRNLAEEDIRVVVYNFMPVLDWVRTDMRHVLSDGSECLRFDPVHFAAFEVHALRRPGAEADYTSVQLAAAQTYWEGMNATQREAFISGLIDVFPGCKLGLTLDDLRAMLAKYDSIDRNRLKENYARFLRAVVPVAEEVGVRLAVHPDDPPFPILGLPRIVSTAQDVEDIFSMVDSPANGLCFCTGSFSVRADNDLPAMVRKFGPRIHAVHLRSTKREADGSFFEADHLGGSVDMYAVVKELLAEQDRRKATGRADCHLAFRPDHGHTMMDDLAKPPAANPGYTAIGRMRGLSELRGMQTAIRKGMMSSV